MIKENNLMILLSYLYKIKFQEILYKIFPCIEIIYKIIYIEIYIYIPVISNHSYNFFHNYEYFKISIILVYIARLINIAKQ